MTKHREPPLEERPENCGVLRHLARGSGKPLAASPSAEKDPYYQCGSHPDIVERVWDQLGSELPSSVKWLVFGSPALVHERSGLVLAVALGTQYALRVPALELASASRLEVRHVYRGAGVVFDLSEFGPTWRFGAWDAREPDWVRAEHGFLDAA